MPSTRRGRLGLCRRELLVIFCLLTIGAPLLSHGMLFWILACSSGQLAFDVIANPSKPDPAALGAIVGDILVGNVWPVFLWFARAHP